MAQHRWCLARWLPFTKSAFLSIQPINADVRVIALELVLIADWLNRLFCYYFRHKSSVRILMSNTERSGSIQQSGKLVCVRVRRWPNL